MAAARCSLLADSSGDISREFIHDTGNGKLGRLILLDVRKTGGVNSTTRLMPSSREHPPRQIGVGDGGYQRDAVTGIGKPVQQLDLSPTLSVSVGD